MNDYDDYDGGRFEGPDEGDVGSTSETDTKARSYTDYLRDKGDKTALREELDKEIDRISENFEMLDSGYQQTFGDFFGIGGTPATIVQDAMGNIQTYNPFGDRVTAERAGDLARARGEYDLARDIYNDMDFDEPGIADNVDRFA